jgi:hypothetical protein
MLLVLSRMSLTSALLPVGACFRQRRGVLPARCLHRPTSPLCPRTAAFVLFPVTCVARAELMGLVSCLHAPYLLPQRGALQLNVHVVDCAVRPATTVRA